MASVTLIPVPDALCIIFSAPLVTTLLSVLILRESLNMIKVMTSEGTATCISVQVVSGLILILGVFLACKPPFLFPSSVRGEASQEVRTLGLMLALAACISTGMMSVLVARVRQVSSSLLVFWTAGLGLVIATIYCLIQPDSMILSRQVVNISASSWALYTGLAVSGLVGFICMTKSLQLIPPSLVIGLRSLNLVLAIIVQTIITGKRADLVSWVGGGLIVTGESGDNERRTLTESSFRSSHGRLPSEPSQLHQEVLAFPRILCKREIKAIIILFILMTNSPSWLPTFVVEYLVHSLTVRSRACPRLYIVIMDQAECLSCKLNTVNFR